MLGVHVGLDLEHETGEFFFIRLHGTFHLVGGRGSGAANNRHAWLRWRREIDHGVKQGLHAEVIHRRAKENRRLPARQIGCAVEGVRCAAHEFDFAAHLCHLVWNQFIQARVVQSLDDFRRAFSACGSKKAMLSLYR